MVDIDASEQEQWEQVKQWLRENGAYIVAGIIVGALGIAGWQWWEAREERLAQEASAKYEQLLEAYGKSDRKQGETLLANLERDYAKSPYVDQALLATARVEVESGNLDKALTILTRVMTGSPDPQLQLVARLRAARVQIAKNQPDAAIALLDAAKPGAFEPRFTEVRGDALLAKGDRAGALKAYEKARAAAVPDVVDRSMLDLKIKDLTTS